MSDDTTDTEVHDVENGDAAEPARGRCYGAPLTASHGQAVLHATPETYLEVVEAAHDDGFLMCVDLTAVDYLHHPGRAAMPADLEPQRFEVVVNLIAHARRERLRIRVQVPADEPTVPSLYELYAGTDAMEREAYDMFGITFDGHPDLTRILMPEDWVGHPLRKDYDPGCIPVQFKAASANR